MGSFEIIGAASIFLLSVGAFIISFLQFKEKGYLFNNAYLYASKEQRESMNKKPYYRQSAICFFMAGITFGLIFINLFLQNSILDILVAIDGIAVLIYAVVSSLRILK